MNSRKRFTLDSSGRYLCVLKNGSEFFIGTWIYTDGSGLESVFRAPDNSIKHVSHAACNIFKIDESKTAEEQLRSCIEKNIVELL